MKENSNKGITLIALVVTIMVLIILATVTINLVFSENGLINQAEKSKEHESNAVASDEKVLKGYEGQIEKHIPFNPSTITIGEATRVSDYGKMVENYKVNSKNKSSKIELLFFYLSFFSIS